jgi:N utilization substance protein B
VSAKSKERRQARIWALRLTYAFDVKHGEDDGALAVADEIELSTDLEKVGQELFDGYLAERPAVDATIDKRLQNWTLARMAVLDRSILRLGCYELLYRADTPTRVIINEWIELAKSYGSEGRTAGLVNGVLDRIAKDHRSG